MMLSRYESFLSVLVLAVLGAAAAFSSQAAEGDSKHELTSGGLTRTYLQHDPPKLDGSTPLPLVIVLHGGTGNGAGMARSTKFSTLADTQRFIVAYPNGYKNHWGDGRGTTPSDKVGVNDVQFLDDVIDDIAKRTPVDRTRIYATGISNGAMMCQRLAIERSKTYAAIGPVAGTIAQNLRKKGEIAGAVAVIEFHGTDDKFVPYNGGVMTRGEGGVILSVVQTLAIWKKNDSAKIEPEITNVVDSDTSDGCNAVRFTYAARPKGTDVVFYKILGGGHTWPGSARTSYGGIAGNVCMDIDATELIWEFFAKHQKK